MCLIITAIAAVVFGVLFAIGCRSGWTYKGAIMTTMLMFWAAALMWSVDGIASVMEGGAFFDISTEDAVLGAIIVGCGLAVFGLLVLRERGRIIRTKVTSAAA